MNTRWQRGMVFLLGATLGIASCQGVASTGDGSSTSDGALNGLSPGTIGFSATTYSVAQSAGSVEITVARSGGALGSDTVSYATSDGSATAPSDYTTTSGSVKFSAGSSTSQTISIPISNAAPTTDDKTFTITLSDVQGRATLGTASAVVTIDGSGTTPTPPSGGKLAISISGNHFVDAAAQTVQLRGVNFSGMEFVAVGGWDPSDPTGGQGGQAYGPNWSAIAGWKANVVRIPLNEASWLGYTCTDTDGTQVNPDPGANYKSTLASLVANANAAGLYVILDLHWAAPGKACPELQSQMADSDNSIDFWTSIANTYKGNPSVMFELFNEPYFNFDFSGNDWTDMMNGTGGSFSGYPATSSSGNWQNVMTSWSVASYQAMINAVRATGATNPVLVGAMNYSSDLSEWLANKPSDPLNQLAAVAHLYPDYGTTYSATSTCTSANYDVWACPNYAPDIFNEITGIQAAGIPVIATETGDMDSPGTTAAPLISTVTSFADSTGMSLLAWSWDVWGDSQNVLISDVNGTPTDGEGVAFKAWLGSH